MSVANKTIFFFSKNTIVEFFSKVVVYADALFLIRIELRTVPRSSRLLDLVTR